MPNLPVLSLWLIGLAGAADPWGRPEHVRAVSVPIEDWASRDQARSVRVFWDGPSEATIRVLDGGRWKSVAIGAHSGIRTRPLPADAVLRVRLAGSTRWSPVIAIDPVDDPVSTGRIGAWGGGDVVGQIALDRLSGDVYASTIGGGLLLRPAREQPLAGATAKVGEWQVLGRSDGLPDSRVVSVDARDGTVLVGTAEGMAVMTSGRVESIVDQALADPWVQAVHVGVDGAWWVGTYRGLSVRDPGATEFRTVLEPWSVFSLAEARGGGVWAGYEGLQHVSMDGEATPWLDAVHVYDAVDTPSGLVVATTEFGVLSVPVPRAPEPLSQLVDRDAYGVAVGPGGIWMAAGELGLIDPQGGMWGRGAGLPASGVRSVLAMPDASLFVGTDRGLARVVPREGVPLIDARMGGRWPASTPVTHVAVSAAGLWVAGEAGIQTAGEPHPAARDLVVAAGADNHVVLTRPSGETWAVGERIVRLDRRGRLDSWWPPAKVTVGAVQPGAGLYVGGTDGLWRLDPVRSRFVPVSTLRDVHDVAASTQGLWVVAGSGVFRVIGAAVSTYLQTGVPLCVSEAPGGAWVGTRDGLERLIVDGTDVRVEDVLGEADAGVSIQAVASDAQGVWFATESGQVGRVVDGRVGLVTLEASDPPTIHDLAPDGDAVWVGTEAGVYRVSLSSSVATDALPADASSPGD